jgi:hypothetical protein
MVEYAQCALRIGNDETGGEGCRQGWTARSDFGTRECGKDEPGEDIDGLRDQGRTTAYCGESGPGRGHAKRPRDIDSYSFPDND